MIFVRLTRVRKKMNRERQVKLTARKLVLKCIERARTNAAIRLEGEKRDNLGEWIRIMLVIWMYFMNKCTQWAIIQL